MSTEFMSAFEIIVCAIAVIVGIKCLFWMWDIWNMEG